MIINRIPRMAKGGIVNDNSLFFNVGKFPIRTKELVEPLDKKYVRIYYRTKNRRIKKKQLKKSLFLQIVTKCGLGNIHKVEVKICNSIIGEYQSAK